MSDDFIRIDSLSKQFGKRVPLALDQLNLNFPSGELIGIVGPDGAGKTTLIRLIASLLMPTSGSITVNGFDTIKDKEKISEMISYMPQRFGLYEDLSVRQNLDLYAKLRGLSKDKKEETYEELLQFTGLKEFQKRLAGDLSGGMKQKLSLACALIIKPQLLLLDEPTVGVDPVSRRQLWEMILKLSEEKITILWSTAYLDDAAKSKKVLLLNQGKALFYGPPDDLTNTMKNRTYHLLTAEGMKRKVLQKSLLAPEVIDAVIQGDKIRLVMKKGSEPSYLNELSSEITEIKPVPPRFEDAFIEALGGCPKIISPLAQLSPTISLTNHVIVAEELTKNFGSFTAVDHINFTVKRGEIFGLLGPNGAGKSTTFKMLSGLLTPTSGKCSVAGLSMQKAKSEARSRMGYMAQKFSLYGNLTLLQNLSFFSGIYPVDELKREAILNKIIEIFDFGPYVDQEAEELPLGFKQRLSLASAVMHGPEILFLDEPTSGVDPVTRREFWSHINALVEKGVTVLITTHFMDEAEYCDRIALINQGKIITIDSPEALKKSVTSKELLEPTLEDAFIILSSTKEKG